MTERSGNEIWEQIKRENREKAEAALAQRKAEAAARGKEPFDLEKLETMADTSTEGRKDPIEQRRAYYEYKYYVEHPEYMTLRELADLVNLVSRY